LPLPVRDAVERRRLHALLDAATERPLTLVSAPAGFGKTTLLATWAAAQEAQPAWLSADEVEDGPGFWTAAVRALESATGTRRGAGTSDEPALDAVMRIAARSSRRVVLVVDDFHLCRSRAVLEPLARLVARAPANLNVVLGCRRDPALALHRLRLAGHVTELRARDLAFDLEEAVGFIAGAGLDLDLELVEALLERTEGWAAALRFAVISLRANRAAKPFVLALSRTERALSDYLVAEVLASQPPRMREFLLRTSICDRIDGALADELTGRSDSERVLDALERDNVLIELEPDGRWYRYHPLFAELLRAECERKLRDELVGLHLRAARRFDADGDRLAALPHALAGGDVALAAQLVSRLWVEIDGRGNVRLARAVLDVVEHDAVADHPQLCLLAAWERLREGRVGEAEAWLSLADRGASRFGRRRPAYDLGRGLLEVRRARLRGDLGGVDRAVERLAQPELLPCVPRDGEGRWSLILCARAASAAWRGNLDVAVTMLEGALDTARRAELRSVEADATAMLALTCAFRGELKRAERLARPLVASLDDERGWQQPGVAALLALARCSLDWDDLEDARDLAEQARELAERVGDRVGRHAARLVSAEAVAGTADDDEPARLELSALAMEEDTAPLPPLLVPSSDVLRAEIARDDGDPELAESILEAGDRPEHHVAAARLALASGDTARACELLQRVLDASSVARPTLVRAAVLRSVAAERSGDDDEACAWVERALELAEPEAIRRPFADVGPDMTRILRRSIRRGTAHRWLAGSLLAALEGREASGGHATRELLDPLSERETVVLRYLPTLLSNQEIAGELYVSVNTVKTHLKSIYRKLGASDRREAVRLARDLRLVG
jgi:LuxR family maltose regulon positive regulatory protein